MSDISTSPWILGLTEDENQLSSEVVATYRLMETANLTWHFFIGFVIGRHCDCRDRNDIELILIVRGIGSNQISAAHCQLLLVQRIETLPPFLTHRNQICLLQLLEMEANRRLVYLAVEFIDNIIDAQPHAAQVRHDLLSCLVSQGFGKSHRINVHVYHCIDIYRYVKRSK